MSNGADLLVWGLAGSPRGARRVVRQLKEHTIGCATSFGGCGVAWRLTLEIKADYLTGAGLEAYPPARRLAARVVGLTTML